MCRRSFGEAIAVASMKFGQVTVGIVLIAPFAKEYGRGQRRIIHRSLRPSCFKTRERAANWVFFAVILDTKLLRNVLEIMKEAVLPSIVALAIMNHPFIPNTKPAIVTQVEYPIKGGKLTKKVMNQRISQPAGSSLHLLA